MMIEEASPAPARAEAARDTSPITVRWSEVKALFVDDPADSVRQASGLVDESVARLVTAVRDRQASLAAFWQDSTNAGTEELRKTLQNYLRFSEDLEQMSAKATTSSRPEITGRPGAVTAS